MMFGEMNFFDGLTVVSLFVLGLTIYNLFIRSRNNDSTSFSYIVSVAANCQDSLEILKRQFEAEQIANNHQNLLLELRENRMRRFLEQKLGYQIDHAVDENDDLHSEKVALYNAIVETLSSDEVRQLYFNLGIDVENVATSMSPKPRLVRALIVEVDRQNKLDELTTAFRRMQ